MTEPRSPIPNALATSQPAPEPPPPLRVAIYRLMPNIVALRMEGYMLTEALQLLQARGHLPPEIYRAGAGKGTNTAHARKLVAKFWDRFAKGTDEKQQTMHVPIPNPAGLPAEAPAIAAPVTRGPPAIPFPTIQPTVTVPRELTLEEINPIAARLAAAAARAAAEHREKRPEDAEKRR